MTLTLDVPKGPLESLVLQNKKTSVTIKEDTNKYSHLVQAADSSKPITRFRCADNGIKTITNDLRQKKNTQTTS